MASIYGGGGVGLTVCLRNCFKISYRRIGTELKQLFSDAPPQLGGWTINNQIRCARWHLLAMVTKNRDNREPNDPSVGLTV